MDELPDLTLIATDGSPLSLAALRGRPSVVYFYPKDDTSGCTKEAQDFSRLAADFTTAGVRVIGVSKDTPASHQRFTGKHQLEVALASDETGAVCEAFGAWVEKSMYGKKYMGIDRSTFLFDGAGRLARAWRKVKVPGHADEVLAAAQALRAAESSHSSA
ncbi:peroxiredoxin [uncultured Sphingomonas sp.]|uniref:peroxiredoxin n=1 Tax=uncultured Sphingomonas sp. TaxID=158754 RepID=UPI0035C9760A